MEWNDILKTICEILLFPVISDLSIWLCVFINAKINEIKQKTKDETSKKYLDMLNTTITDAVLTTTQTYVESLKKQGSFDKEAQLYAFQMTYEAVMKLLTEEAEEYLTESLGDLDTYITNRIEAEVKMTKGI